MRERKLKVKIIKKNQIIIFILALVLVTTGYINYSLNNNYIIQTTGTLTNEPIASIGDAVLVSSNSIEEEQKKQEEAENIVETSSKTQEDYFIKSKLERELMYSETLSNYQKISENQNISEEQRQIAITEIKKISETKNAIMISENLIKTKGIEDVVIFVNTESINIIVKSEELEDAKIAQIQNIVTREFEVSIEKIHISKK